MLFRHIIIRTMDIKCVSTEVKLIYYVLG